MNRAFGTDRPSGRWWTALVVAGLVVLLAPRAFAQAAPEPAAPDAPRVAAVGDSAEEVPVPAVTPAAPGATNDPNAQPMIKLRKVRLVGEGRTVVRSGPGDSYALSGAYDKGAVFPVIAKSGDWYNIRLSEIEAAWIHSALVEEFEDLSDLEFRPNPKAYTRTGAYVLSGYAGGYAFDGKSNSFVVGGRLGYYVFDRITAEVGLSYTHINRPAEIVESLFGLTLEAEKFHMLFYNLNITWEILPGRQMVPFLTVGAGSSIMRGETEPAFNFGAGTQLFLSKRTAMRWEVRDYRFSTGNGTSRVSNDNIEFTLGTSYLF